MADHTLLAHDASPILHGSDDAYEEMVLLFEEGSRVRIETRRAAAVRSKDECSYRVIAVRLASAREGTCCVDLELLREDLADGTRTEQPFRRGLPGIDVQPGQVEGGGDAAGGGDCGLPCVAGRGRQNARLCGRSFAG